MACKKLQHIQKQTQPYLLSKRGLLYIFKEEEKLSTTITYSMFIKTIKSDAKTGRADVWNL